MRIQNIMLPTDFSPCANGAAHHAISLSKMFGSTIHFFNAIEFGAIPGVDETRLVCISDEIALQAEDMSSKNLKKMAAAPELEHLKVITAHRRGHSAASNIMQYAKEKNIDLIVMGTHGWRGVRKLIMGSVTQEVIRRASCPVLSVTENLGRKQHLTLARILVPIDFSEHSLNALKFAGKIASAYNARLQLLHIVHQPVLPSFYLNKKKGPDELDRLMGLSKCALLRFNRKAGNTPIPVDYHVSPGWAASQIIRFANDQNSDLIVMSTHGLTGMKYFLIGSVTQKVIQRTPCPVLTLKPQAKNAEEHPRKAL